MAPCPLITQKTHSDRYFRLRSLCCRTFIRKYSGDLHELPIMFTVAACWVPHLRVLQIRRAKVFCVSPL